MNSVTVATFTNVRIVEHVNAIIKTSNALPFKSEKLIICPRRPDLPDGFRWETDPLFNAYSFPHTINTFMLNKFADYIDTDLVIYVHDDGFAINPGQWTDEFLMYDYIGAPWPAEWCRDNRVGNGGFSLRSRILLDLCKIGPKQSPVDPEDVHVCRTNYEWFLQRKCRFAPIDLAMRWSYESDLRDYPGRSIRQSFGFHGKHLVTQAMQAR